MQNAFLKLAAERYAHHMRCPGFNSQQYVCSTSFSNTADFGPRIGLLHKSAGFTKRLGRGTGSKEKVEEEENKDILEENNKETVSDGDDQR